MQGVCSWWRWLTQRLQAWREYGPTYKIEKAMRIRMLKGRLQNSPASSSVRAVDFDAVRLQSGCSMYDESIAIGRYFMPLLAVMLPKRCDRRVPSSRTDSTRIIHGYAVPS